MNLNRAIERFIGVGNWGWTLERDPSSELERQRIEINVLSMA